MSSIETWTSQEIRERDALTMANARLLIKACKSTSNAGLYMRLFGTGFCTATSSCKVLGLNPDGNITNYSEMINFIRDEAIRDDDQRRN